MANRTEWAQYQALRDAIIEAVDEWWNSLSENDKVDIYYQES